jgi:hypothetical protein
MLTSIVVEGFTVSKLVLTLCTSAAKAGTENKALIAAVNRCATQKLRVSSFEPRVSNNLSGKTVC